MRKLSFDYNQKVFYIADTHFGHYNIIKHCNRPFKDDREMDGTMIENWNNTVTPKDIVIVVGDFSYKGTRTDELVHKLNGKKYLILGNHDKPDMEGFEGKYDMALIKDNDKLIHVCHYPLTEWYGYFRDTLHFYGHIHNSQNRAKEIMDSIPHAYNVGADLLGFTPRTADEIITGKF